MTENGMSRGRVLLWRIVLGLALLAAWEVAGRSYELGLFSRPSQVLARLLSWGGRNLEIHIFYTTMEMITGLGIGTAFGVVLGLIIGRTERLAEILRPIILALYAAPLITLSPLLIAWFGLGMQPKIILVASVVFFLVFYNTFAGARALDQDLLSSLQLMGSTRRENFLKVVAPAATAWILAGLRIALPYSLAATVTAEMLGSRLGIGVLISNAAVQFDMAGLYAAVFILMVMGLIINMIADLLEKWALRWRAVG